MLTIASHRRVVRTEYGVLHTRRATRRDHAAHHRLRGEARDSIRCQHGRLRDGAARPLDYIEAGRAARPARPRAAAARRRRAGRLLPVRGLLARHRPPRGLREGDRRVRAAEGATSSPNAATARISPRGQPPGERHRHRRRRLRRRHGASTSCSRPAATCACSTSLLHGQEDVAAELEGKGVEVVRGDIRDADARAKALEGAEAVVHLAAIVGDPACARDPELSQRGERGGQPRRSSPTPAPPAWSASCSPPPARTTAAWPIRRSRSTRAASCAPVSLYAEQKVGDREGAARGRPQRPQAHLPALRHRVRRGPPDALRPDRERVHARPLGGASTWRCSASCSGAPTSTSATPPARCATVLAAPAEQVAGRVFNAGHSDENYRKLDLVEIITGQLGRGDVDVRVARRGPARLQGVLRADQGRARASSPRCACRPGSTELVGALEQERFGDPFDGRYSNIGRCRDAAADPAVRRPLERRRDRGGRGHAALGLAHDGPAHAGVRAGSSPSTSARSTRWRRPAAPPRCTSPTWRPASGRATR